MEDPPRLTLDPVLQATHVHTRAAEYRTPGGTWDQPSLDTLLTEQTRTVGDRVLVVDGARAIGGRDLLDIVAKLAGGLRALGVRAGDVVAWQSSNRWEVIALYRACWRLGAIAAPIHHQAGAAEARALLDRLDPRAVFAASGSALLEWLGAIEIGSAAWERVVEDADRVDEPWADGSALAAVLFTSGSSGVPKGVLHSQGTLTYKARLMRDVHRLSDGDTVLMPAPLAHISGLLNGVTLPGVVPMPSVLMARWDPAVALELIEREHVTFMVGPPTFFVSLMNTPGFGPGKVRSLRLVSSGGAGVSESFVTEATERLRAVVKRTYGSTEAPSIATSPHRHAPDAARRYDGRAVGEVELRVVDPDTGIDLPAASTGELWVRGPEVCCGYLDAAQTAEVFTSDGWFRTRDLAQLTTEGWLTIVGRMNDVIIRGGENIAVAEVEAALEAHDAVEHAVVVAYSDPLMGERVAAYVVGAPFDLTECRTWFEQRGVARYKTPEQVVVVDELPLLATGKPDRDALRRDAQRRFEVTS